MENKRAKHHSIHAPIYALSFSSDFCFRSAVSILGFKILKNAV
jgi:hypothetical protein